MSEDKKVENKTGQNFYTQYFDRPRPVVCCKQSFISYSPFHIAQITNFLKFLCEYSVYGGRMELWMNRKMI